MTEAKLVRLQKVLAERGFASRRGAEALIVQGLVKVNGALVTELGTKVDPDFDKIEVDSKGLKTVNQNKVVLLLNKPVGFTTTKSQNEGMTVIDLVRKHPASQVLNPVGRLDKDSSGLLLLTNDGILQYAIVDPATHVEKEYIVTTTFPALPTQLKRMADGLIIDGHRTRPCVVEAVNAVSYRIILTEGRNRQIRRMADKVGLKVAALKRVRIGPIELHELKEGQWVQLTDEQVNFLREAIK